MVRARSDPPSPGGDEGRLAPHRSRVARPPGTSQNGAVPLELFQVALTLAVIALLVAGARRLGLAYCVVSLFFILVPLATGLNSMPRFLLAVFPVPILLARMGQRRKADTVLTASLALLQGFLMVFWANGFKLIV